MSSSTGMNAYMERHRIGPLFEDLMNKVLRDMPEEPLIYLLRAMYKKAGMEIPQGIRYGGLRKSMSDLRSHQSPERPAKHAHVSRSVDSGGAGASRDYERPWTSPTRRIKPKKSDEVPTTSKHRTEWNSDVRTKASSFDDFWQDHETTKKEKTTSTKRSPQKQMTSSASAWANIGVQEEEEIFTSPEFLGPNRSQKRNQISEEEFLAAEAIQPSLRSESKTPEPSITRSSNHHIRGPRLEAQRHRQELAKILSDGDKDLNDSGVDLDLTRFDDGDAIELLEDADDLRREGVTKIPKSGYKLSRAMRYRENEPKVKLSINVNPSRYSSSSLQAWDDSPGPYDAFNSSEQNSPDQGVSDDEFESVSQVTGPRHPVWKVPDFDGESVATRPTYSSQRALQSSVSHKSFVEKNLTDVDKSDIGRRSFVSNEDLVTSGKPWSAGGNQVSFEEPPSQPHSSRSVRSEVSSGGWMVPDDTEIASAHDWNQRVRGGPKQDPRLMKPQIERRSKCRSSTSALSGVELKDDRTDEPISVSSDDDAPRQRGPGRTPPTKRRRIDH